MSGNIFVYPAQTVTADTLLTSLETKSSAANVLLTSLETKSSAANVLLTSLETKSTAANALLTTIEANTSLDVLDVLDTPLLVAASTNIPASASTPLTVVAALAATCKAIHVANSSTSFLGLYSDPAGTPVLECVVKAGCDIVIPIALAGSVVLGLRNMENSAVVLGLVSINFLG